MASGHCGLLGTIPGPLRSGRSEWHPLCGPRPPSGSWCRLLHQLLTCYEDTNFVFRYASALPPLPNLFSFLPPINTSESASSASQKSLHTNRYTSITVQILESWWRHLFCQTLKLERKVACTFQRKAEDEIRGKSQQFGGFMFLLTLVFLETAQHWEAFLFLSFKYPSFYS